MSVSECARMHMQGKKAAKVWSSQSTDKNAQIFAVRYDRPFEWLSFAPPVGSRKLCQKASPAFLRFQSSPLLSNGTLADLVMQTGKRKQQSLQSHSLNWSLASYYELS